MATITVTAQGTTIGTVTITETLDGDNGDMVLAYLLATHGRDASGNPRTAAQMIAAYWAPIRQQLLDGALRYHQEQAAAAARAAVSPIVSTTDVE